MKRTLTTVIPFVVALLLGSVIPEYVAPPYDPSAMVFLPPGAPRNMLPYTHRDTMPHYKFIPTDMDEDINGLINDKIDYVTWEYMFNDDFLQGLKREM